jgi:hypothetical protein
VHAPLVADPARPASGDDAVDSVVGPNTLGAVIAPCQADQLATDLGRHQVVEVGHILGPDDGQAPMQRMRAAWNRSSVSSRRRTWGLTPEHGAGQGHEPPMGQGITRSRAESSPARSRPSRSPASLVWPKILFLSALAL